MDEIEYCFNCDSEAVWYVDWEWANGLTHRTHMCQTCKDAFEFGQTIPTKQVCRIENSEQIKNP